MNIDDGGHADESLVCLSRGTLLFNSLQLTFPICVVLGVEETRIVRHVMCLAVCWLKNSREAKALSEHKMSTRIIQ